MRWAYLGVIEFVLTVTIIALAAEEAITATTGMDRLEALGDVFFWLGVAFATTGLAAAGVGWRRGAGASRGFITLAIGAILYGLAAVAFSLAVRAAR